MPASTRARYRSPVSAWARLTPRTGAHSWRPGMAPRTIVTRPHQRSSERQLTATDLDDASGNANRAFGIDRKAQPARTADRGTLIERQSLRQRRTRRQQPAAEIRACRAGARILDDRAVLGKE